MCMHVHACIVLVHREWQVRHVVRLIRIRFSGKMKRSPLNNAACGSRQYGARHTPYNWKSQENTNGRGYQSVESNNYQHFPVSNTGRPYDDNFIPLNSTPMMRHEKYNATNQYSPASERSSLGGGWYNRSNYHNMPRSSCNNRYPAYKHSPKQFHGQKRKSYKGAHKQMNISAYLDINSFLEDPWKDLVKKLNDLKDMSKRKGPENESLSNSKLADNDLTERSESKLSKDTNLDNSQYNQDYKNECFVDTSFKMQNTDFSQISKVKNLVESEIDDICSSQDSLNESTFSINDEICEATQENIHQTA